MIWFFQFTYNHKIVWIITDKYKNLYIHTYVDMHKFKLTHSCMHHSHYPAQWGRPRQIHRRKEQEQEQQEQAGAGEEEHQHQQHRQGLHRCWLLHYYPGSPIRILEEINMQIWHVLLTSCIPVYWSCAYLWTNIWYILFNTQLTWQVIFFLIVIYVLQAFIHYKQ